MENNQKEIILLKDLGMEFPTSTSKRKSRYGLFKCFCGTEFKSNFNSVKSNSVKSCGCERYILTHNLSKHRLYSTWKCMIYRCLNKEHKDYKNYGARGITICNEWLNIENFINDMFPTYKEGLTLDRENNDLGYSPDNCRWATKTKQSRNTRLIYSHNTSGYRGIMWVKNINKWKSVIFINNKAKHLGYFANVKDAIEKRNNYILKNNLEHPLN